MPLIKKNFKTAFWGNEKPGYYYAPPDKTKKYPAFAFFPGLGALGSPEALFAEGMLKFVNAGWSPPFIAIGIFSGKSEPEDSETLKYVLENDPDLKPIFAPDQFIWTGLSKGGMRVLEAMGRNYPGLFIPMSPAATGNTVDFTKKHVSWFFHASNDTNPGTPYSLSKNTVDNLNAAFPGSAKLTTYSGGHGGWDTFYDPTWKDPDTGLSIYDWALQALAGIIPGPTPAGPIARKLLLSGKITLSYKLYDDGSTEFIQLS